MLTVCSETMQAGISMRKKRYNGYVIVKDGKKWPTIKFQYTTHPTKPLLVSRSKKVAEFIERLMPDIDEMSNAYALTDKKWQKAIIFAVSVKFFKDEKELNKFADFLLELNSIDLLYWYDHIRRFIEFPKYRERVVKAMLKLFDFI